MVMATGLFQLMELDGGSQKAPACVCVSKRTQSIKGCRPEFIGEKYIN